MSQGEKIVTHAERNLLGCRLPGVHSGPVFCVGAQKDTPKAFSWRACFSDSDMMAVQGRQEDRARSPSSCLGKGPWHPEDFQSQLHHQGHLF